MTTRTDAVAAPGITAGRPRSRPAARTRPAVLTGGGLLTVLLGAALPMIDFFIVNVALPTIDTSLHASTATLELVVAGYGIAYAVLLVPGGRLGDAFGRRRLFTIGLAAFTVTSLACGLAPTAPALVLARVAQGASAALMLPQVLSTIQATTTGDQRARALGMYGAAGGVSSVVGQLLGGGLVAADIAGAGWRPIFLVNVPVGLVGLLLAGRNVPETRSGNPLGVDRLGTALLGVTMLALLIPLMEGSALGWPTWIWVMLGMSPLAAIAFVVVQRRAEHAGRVPLLPPSVVRLPSVRRGLLVGVPFFTGFGGFMFVFAVTLQDGLRFGPLTAGLALTPMAVGFFAASLVSGRAVARFGAGAIPLGVAIQAIGLVITIGTAFLCWPDVRIPELLPGMLVTGVGQGLAMPVLFQVVLSHVPPERAGVGSGALATTQQSALALGVATLGSLFAALSATDLLGMRNAFLLVLAVQVLFAVGVVAAGRVLPDPRPEPDARRLRNQRRLTPSGR